MIRVFWQRKLKKYPFIYFEVFEGRTLDLWIINPIASTDWAYFDPPLYSVYNHKNEKCAIYSIKINLVLHGSLTNIYIVCLCTTDTLSKLILYNRYIVCLCTTDTLSMLILYNRYIVCLCTTDTLSMLILYNRDIVHLIQQIHCRC